jgi:molybdenum cofactor cytidylyltransferase
VVIISLGTRDDSIFLYEAGTMSTAAIILAAGTSSRMGEGRHKLLLQLNGRPVLAHVIEAALASQARPILLVLGYHAGQVRERLADVIASPDISIVENPDYGQGMSTSMKLGIQMLLSDGYKKPQESEVDSALFLTGDQPLITAKVIDMVIEAYRRSGRRIVAPLYDGQRGNPVLFDAGFFPELLEVTGDEGGRSVLKRHTEEVETVEIGDAAAAYDVDTWEAYQRVVEMWDQQHL